MNDIVTMTNIKVTLMIIINKELILIMYNNLYNNVTICKVHFVGYCMWDAITMAHHHLFD